MTNQELNMICNSVYKKIKNIFKDRLVSVILYGSYARGDNDKESDIDIAIIAKGTRIELSKYRDAMVEVMSDFMMEYDALVSLTEIPEDDFIEYQNVLPYYRNIAQEGVSLSA